MSAYYHCNNCDWSWKKSEMPKDTFTIENPPQDTFHFCCSHCKEQFIKDFGDYFGVK
jgi:hypothetical protein